MDNDQSQRRKTATLRTPNPQEDIWPRRDATTDQYRIRTNAELTELQNDSDIIQEIKAHRLRWAGHLQQLENQRLMRLIYEDCDEETTSDQTSAK